ncbi:hypothetical protein M3Y97_00940100 [Aphelenchoides bicaudatus]|nr:hypothetical protein M3Y97_00940100 [Aphelenchoides bicaudatus]
MPVSTGKKSQRFLALFLIAAVLYLALSYRCHLQLKDMSKKYEEMIKLNKILEKAVAKSKPENQKEVTLGETTKQELEGPFLLIDSNCYKRLARNEKCLSPLKVASWTKNTTDKNLLVEYELETSNRRNYYVLHGATKRLLPQTKTIDKEVELVGGDKVWISAAENPQIFLNYFRNSRFIESLKLPIRRNDTRQVIPLEKAQRILRETHRKMEKISKKLGKPVSMFVCGGTSLGWYREDGIITHTQDVDYAMKYQDIKGRASKFVHLFESSFEMRDQIGFENSSLELRFKVEGTAVDLFIQYQDLKDPQKRDYLSGTNLIDKELRWYFPHVEEICAGSLLDSIIFVPCNIEDILAAIYGEWQTDNAHTWGHAVVHRTFSAQEAKKMIRYYTQKP